MPQYGHWMTPLPASSSLPPQFRQLVSSRSWLASREYEGALIPVDIAGIEAQTDDLVHHFLQVVTADLHFNRQIVDVDLAARLDDIQELALLFGRGRHLGLTRPLRQQIRSHAPLRQDKHESCPG